MDAQQLDTTLLKTCRRMRDVCFLKCALRNLLASAVLLSALLAIDKSGLIAGILRTEWNATGIWQNGRLDLPGLELPSPYPTLMFCLLLISILLAVLEAWRGNFTPKTAAIAIDQQAGLKERTTSAASMAVRGLSMSAVLLEDATRHTAGLNLAQTFPYSAGKHGRKLPWALLGVAAMLFLMPDLDLLGSRALIRKQKFLQKQKRDEVKNIARTIRNQARRLEDEMKRKKVTDRKLKELTKRLKQLAKNIDKDPKMDPEMAKKMLSRLQDKIRQEDRNSFAADKLQQLRTPRTRRSLMREAIQKLKNKDMTGAREAMKRLRRKLQRGNMSKDELQRLSKEMKDLAKQLQDMGLQELSKSLQQTADELKDLADLSNVNREKMQKIMKLALKNLKGEDLDLSKLTAEEQKLLKKLQQSLAKMKITEDMLKAMQKAAMEGRVRQVTLKELKDMLRRMREGMGQEDNRKCPSCKGTGKCKVCGGTGWITGPDGKKKKCPNCKGTGKCHDCNGSGKCGNSAGFGLIPGNGGSLGSGGSSGSQAGSRPGQGMWSGSRHRENRTGQYNSRIRARKLAKGQLDMMFVRGLPPSDNRIKAKYVKTMKEVQESPDSLREREFIPREDRDLVKQYNNAIKGVE